MNIFKNTGIAYFVVQHESLDRIRQHGKSKMKQSSLKLYLFLCKRSSGNVVEADAAQVEKQTGLSKNALPRVRTELIRLGLITAEMKPGQGATYTYAVLNLKNGNLFDPAANDGAAYFQVPTVTLFTDSLIQDNRASSLVYASVLAEANRLSTPHLNLSPKKLCALSTVTPETLRSALPVLTIGEIPLIKVAEHKVEILDPYGGRSLNSSPAENDEKFWHLSKEGKRVGVHELLSPENFIRYYTAELPDLVPDRAQQDVQCKFHADSEPSMSVNLEEGVWYCHACAIGGGMREFEMKKLDTENAAEAWRSICARFGLRFLGKRRGATVTQHVYHDEDGHPVSKLKRYEDGSGSWHHFVGGKWKLGRGDRKLTPYNLPDLRAAEVVIITEGEKKADVLGYQGLLDQNGNLVAITCTGSANSWKPELVDYFRGKKVLVFPDADEPGRRYCEAVTGSLKHANVQYDVVDFSGYGHDVRDFLRDHSAAELVEYISSDWLKPLATAETVPVNPYHYI